MNPTRVFAGLFLILGALAVPALTPTLTVSVSVVVLYALTVIIAGGGVALTALGFIASPPGTMRTEAVRIAYEVPEPGSLDLSGMTLIFRAGRRVKLRLPLRAVKQIATRRVGDLMEVQLQTGVTTYSLMLHSASPVLDKMLGLIADAESSGKSAIRVTKGSKQPLIQP